MNSLSTDVQRQDVFPEELLTERHIGQRDVIRIRGTIRQREFEFAIAQLEVQEILHNCIQARSYVLLHCSALVLIAQSIVGHRVA